MRAIFLMILLAIVVALSYTAGEDAGYKKALSEIKPAPPAPRVTDQQCVSWLFEANLKDVKKRICR